MCRSGRLGLMGFAWLLIAPAVVYAQASITGVVRDTSGAVLPGVTVEAASPALIERVRSAVTDGTGQYRIENLRPGAYSVTFTLPGFATVRREGIELTGTFVATVNAELRVGALEETITVTGETPTVDLQSTTRQRVMDRQILDTIPTGRTEASIGILIPGLTVTGRHDVGGSAGVGGTPFPFLMAHGSRSNSTTHTLAGVESTLQAANGGGMTQTANPAATQELTFDVAAHNAETRGGGPRTNRVPREGGNTFGGIFFANFANSAMQGSNFTQDLQDRGLRTPNSLDANWEINPGFGGPIMQDRVWFYTAFRRIRKSEFVAGLFHNRNLNNPNVWTFDPDSGRPVTNELKHTDGQLRLTWQVTPRNKIGFTWVEQVFCWCPLTASATTAAEAATWRSFPYDRTQQAEWTSPVTSRLLLEAGGLFINKVSPEAAAPFLGSNMIPVTEQSTGMTYRGSGPFRRRVERSVHWRAALSYVTGSHALKAGIMDNPGKNPWHNYDYQPISYRFNNGVPNQLTQWANPFDLETDIDHSLGLFAQDRWTLLKGLTLNYGLRYDHFASSYPEEHLGPAVLVPTRNFTFPGAKTLAYHDLSPRLGVSYDPFGTGKTAIKVSLNRYVEALGEGGLTRNVNPVSNLIISTTRSWTDANRDFVPNCNLVDPLANGECGVMSNIEFGQVGLGEGGVRGRGLGALYDPDMLRGWARREYSWEFSAGVQRELLPQVSVDAAYFRRWFGNFIVTDNRATAPTDFDQFSITAPVDPRLPGGGGYVISGLYDVNPAKFGVVDNFVTRAQKYGKQVEYWHGADINLNARPRPGFLLQGGISTGRRVTDNCEIRAKLDNPSPRYCRVTEAFLTQVKFLGSYTIPRLDVQLSGAFQTMPGPQIAANYNAPTAAVVPSLGRNLAGGARNVTVNLVEPGTMYGGRMNQLDLRVAKVLRFGRSRTSIGVDLFNALNGNAVLQENSAFGAWRQPTEILLARFIRLSVQFDF